MALALNNLQGLICHKTKKILLLDKGVNPILLFPFGLYCYTSTTVTCSEPLEFSWTQCIHSGQLPGISLEIIFSHIEGKVDILTCTHRFYKSFVFISTYLFTYNLFPFWFSLQVGNQACPFVNSEKNVFQLHTNSKQLSSLTLFLYIFILYFV